MNRKSTEHAENYAKLTAYQIVVRGMIELDMPVGEDGDTFLVDILHIGNPTPEDVFARKELIEKLSDDAKDIIGIIFHAPAEVLEEICSPVFNQVSRPRLKEWLAYQGWGRRKIQRSFDELKKFCSELDGIEL